jgi:hypothetical protein
MSYVRVLLQQGCRTYGTRAQNDTWDDFLGTRNSLLSQFSSFLLSDQLLYSEKNRCVHIHTSDCVQTISELPGECGQYQRLGCGLGVSGLEYRQGQ